MKHLSPTAAATFRKAADGVVHCDNPKKQADIAAFCETWMANLHDQHEELR